MTELKLFTQEQTEMTSDDYYTPKWIFDALGVHFDLDVASPPDGPPFTPCDRYYTQADDGLVQPWSGLVWMNPPYSKPAPWVDRFIAHGNGLALLPFAKSKWCETLWESPAQVAFIYVVKFLRPGGETPAAIFQPLALWAIGHDAINALHSSGLGKVR